jgi:hypothetical protein
MKITSQAQMPSNATAALGREIKELKKGAKQSAFSLDVTGTPPKVTSDEIRRMLNTARASKSYQANADKFQFKLVGQTLTLKEQGFFSKLKGHFNIDREAREEQRAQAAKLIQNAFSTARLEMNSSIDITSTTDRISHDDAVQIQKNLMTDSDLAPKAKELGTRADVVTNDSVTWENLMTDDHAGVSDSRSDNVASYEAYSEPENKQQLLDRREPSGSLDSSSNSVTDWLKHNQPDADLYRQAYNPHSSWENAGLINPMPQGNQLFQGGFDSSRRDSMASDTSETKIFDLLLNKH